MELGDVHEIITFPEFCSIHVLHKDSEALILDILSHTGLFCHRCIFFSHGEKLGVKSFQAVAQIPFRVV